MSKTGGQQSIVDDFMYGSNVATAHVAIRLGFLRKVYGILTSQLVLTTLVGFIFMMHDGIKLFVQQNNWMMLVAVLGTFATLFPLMIKRQETPTNYILLGAFTLMEAYTVGVVVTMYDKMVVLEAVLLTLGVTVALTLYTMGLQCMGSWIVRLFMGDDTGHVFTVVVPNSADGPSNLSGWRHLVLYVHCFRYPHDDAQALPGGIYSGGHQPVS